jgi:hypothetical protein
MKFQPIQTYMVPILIYFTFQFFWDVTYGLRQQQQGEDTFKR